MFKLILLLCSCIALQAQLIVANGSVQAHTEVFGDTDISPISTKITSQLVMDNGIESIHGDILIKAVSLKSTKADRDKNMYALLHALEYPTITFSIDEVHKVGDDYEIIGGLFLNGVNKKVKTKAHIIEENNHLVMEGDFSILLTQFGMEPPTLLFLTVRDQIDIHYDIDFMKE